jgi:hypothetical protein
LPKGLSHNPFPFERAEKESAFLFHPRYGFFWNGHPLWQKLRLVCESTTLVHGAKGSGRTALALALGKYLGNRSVLTSYSNRPQRLKDLQSLFSKIMLDFIATNPFYLPRDGSRASLLKQWVGTHMPDSLIQARLSQAGEDLEIADWVHDAGDEKTRADYLAEARKILNKFGKLDGGEPQVYDAGQSFEILIQCAQALGFSRVRTVFDLGDHLRNDDLQDLDDLIHEAPNQIEIIIFAPVGATWVDQLESSFVTETLDWKHGGVNLLEKMVTHRWKIVSQNNPPQAFFLDGAFEYLIEISQTNPGRFMALWNKLMDLKGGTPKISVELINTARKLVDE